MGSELFSRGEKCLFRGKPWDKWSLPQLLPGKLIPTMPRKSTGQGGRDGGMEREPAGMSTQLLAKDDGSRNRKRERREKDEDEWKEWDIEIKSNWEREKKREGERDQLRTSEKEKGIRSVSDRRGGPPTLRVSGHPWRVRAQEGQAWPLFPCRRLAWSGTRRQRVELVWRVNPQLNSQLISRTPTTTSNSYWKLSPCLILSIFSQCKQASLFAIPL